MIFLQPVAFIVAALLQIVTCNRYLPTCTGLEQFMVNTDAALAVCEHDDECCTMVTCNTVQEMYIDAIHSSTFTLFPCSNPPAIALTVRNITEDIFTGTLSESGSTRVFVTRMMSGGYVTDISLNITLDFSISGEVGIEADLNQVTVPESGGPSVSDITLVINGHTRIPLDIASCDSTTTQEFSATNPSTLSGNMTSDSARCCLSYRLGSLVSLAFLVFLLTRLAVPKMTHHLPACLEQLV